MKSFDWAKKRHSILKITKSTRQLPSTHIDFSNLQHRTSIPNLISHINEMETHQAHAADRHRHFFIRVSITCTFTIKKNVKNPWIVRWWKRWREQQQSKKRRMKITLFHNVSYLNLIYGNHSHPPSSGKNCETRIRQLARASLCRVVIQCLGAIKL